MPDAEKKYYAYMVICSDNTIYSGFTTNLEKRINTHNSGKGAKYTRTRTPVHLVYWEEFYDKSNALKKEYSLKKLTRTKKLELISNFKKKV